MKNIIKFLLITAFAFIATNINAQTSVESIVIQKHNRNAVKLEINQPEQITQTALDQRFKRSGLKGKTSKGVLYIKVLHYLKLASVN